MPEPTPNYLEALLQTIEKVAVEMVCVCPGKDDGLLPINSLLSKGEEIATQFPLLSPQPQALALGRQAFDKAGFEAVQIQQLGNGVGWMQSALPLAQSAKALTEHSPLDAVQTATASTSAPTASTPAAATAASVPAPAKAESGAAKVGATKGDTNAGFIKVDTMKLASLVDVAREMVIAQSLVAADKDLPTLQSQTLSRNMARLGRITNDLQRTAMSRRMVPIRALFEKLIRLIRDSAVKIGGQAELILGGKDTGPDRTFNSYGNGNR